MDNLEELLKLGKIKLDLGCGPRKVDASFIGLDKHALPGVDIVSDLESGSLPFPTNSADEVNASHVLEHISNYLPLIEEIWRVMKPGALLRVSVPNYKHEIAYTDPTHVRVFTPRSFNFFDPEKALFKETGWYLSPARFRIVERLETDREISYKLEAKKRRILFVAPPDSIHTLRWVESLSRYGHTIHVASRRMKGVSRFAIGSGENADRSGRFRDMPENLSRAVRLSDYDVVHAHFATCYGHTLTVVPGGIRRVLSVWGEDVLDESQGNQELRTRLVRGLEAADNVTTTSNHMKSVLVGEYSVPESKVFVMPWGYKSTFRMESPSKETYEKFGLCGDIPVITSGRVCREQNNIEKIIDAIMGSSARLQLLILTGKLSNPAYLQQLREKTRSDNRIKYLDPLDEIDLAKVYNISEAVISIPFVDQLSTTLLEALACGTPIICSDIPVYHERITHGKNGLFVDPNDVNQIRQAMEYFLDKTNKARMQHFAMNSVSRDSWELNVRNLMSVYDAPR